MIQDFNINIKTVFNTILIRFYNETIFNQIQHLETYCLNNLSLFSKYETKIKKETGQNPLFIRT